MPATAMGSVTRAGSDLRSNRRPEELDAQCRKTYPTYKKNKCGWGAECGSEKRRPMPMGGGSHECLLRTLAKKSNHALAF